MVKIGIVGIGFMGFTHFEAARAVRGARVTAIATRSEQKLRGDWTGIHGNFGPPARKIDVSDLKCFSDYRELIRDPDVDLIDVCVPTDRHKEVVLAAVAAGKPVLVEKPIAVSLNDAKEMLQAAQSADVSLYVAHALPLMAEFRFAADAIRSKNYGDLLAAHFRRIICTPDWSADMSNFRNLGGWGIDLHIHDNHFITWTCGRPKAVFSRGLLQEGFVNHVHTSYVYDDGPSLTCVSGGIAASGLQFAHGFELFFENATLLFQAGTCGGKWTVDRPLTLVLNDGTLTTPDLPDNDSWCAAFTDELQIVADSISTGSAAGPLEVQIAIDALEICCAEARSIENGKLVVL